MKLALRPWGRRWTIALAVGTALSPLAGCAPISQQLAKIPGAAQLTSDKKTLAEDDQSKLPYARLCESREDFAQAEHIYRTLLEKYPENQMVHHRLGIIYARRGLHEESQQHFQTALRVDKPNAALLSDLGYAYYLQHRLDEAEQVINDALAIEPNNQSAAINLGLVLGEQGRYEEAMRVFRRSGTEAEALANMAYIHTQQGELTLAMQCYSQALALDNSMRSAATAMIQLDKHVRSQDRASEAQQAAQSLVPQAGPTAQPRALVTFDDPAPQAGSQPPQAVQAVAMQPWPEQHSQPTAAPGPVAFTVPMPPAMVAPVMQPPTAPQPLAMPGYGAQAHPLPHAGLAQPLSAGTLPQHQPAMFGVQSSPYGQVHQNQPPIFGPQPQPVNQPHGAVQYQAQQTSAASSEPGARITNVRPFGQ